MAHWRFEVDGGKYTHLDLTGKEIVALERRLGVDWGQLRPVGSMEHRLAILETFLARTDPEKAKERVEAMTLAELEAVITFDDADDDLPTSYEDGIPKAGDAP